MVKKCVHYWLVEQPSGPISKARCKLCMEVKEFANSIEANIAWLKSSDSKVRPSFYKRRNKNG